MAFSPYFRIFVSDDPASIQDHSSIDLYVECQCRHPNIRMDRVAGFCQAIHDAAFYLPGL